MNATALLQTLRASGVVLAINGDKLAIDAPAPLPDTLLSQLRAYKSELMVLLAANQAPGHETILDWHSERRAILQVDAGFSADDAKAQAWALTRARYDLPDDYLLH